MKNNRAASNFFETPGAKDQIEALLGCSIEGYIQDQTVAVGGVAYIDRVTGLLFTPDNLDDGATRNGTWTLANSDWRPYTLKYASKKKVFTAVAWVNGSTNAYEVRLTKIGRTVTAHFGLNTWTAGWMQAAGTASYNWVTPIPDEFLTEAPMRFFQKNLNSNNWITVRLTKTQLTLSTPTADSLSNSFESPYVYTVDKLEV